MEKEITEGEIQARMRWDLLVLSSNQMCSIALDLPLLHCHLATACAQVCYVAQGRQYYRQSVVKVLALLFLKLANRYETALVAPRTAIGMLSRDSCGIA